jgi:serine/threonine-protein kinase
VGVTKIGDYALTRELGHGGMGTVFQALSPQGATVAIKTMVLAEGLDASARWETVERFQREARAIRSLDHPQIVKVLDIGADHDTFFIVMEFLDGQTIRELLRTAGMMRLDRAVEIMILVCRGLSYAHGLGIIHRDIKPDNIMVLRNGAVKLTDFGLATVSAEKGMTQTGTMMGTLAYMSPEQARGESADARSDVFSLGATFYEMLTGVQAFQGQTPAVTLNKILSEDPPPIQGLPPHIEHVAHRCLRRDPEQRFQKVDDIVAALGAPATAQSTGTIIVPTRTATSSAARPPDPELVLSLTSPPPAFACSKCREPMDRNVATCWKCGTPNPALAKRAEHMRRQQQLDDVLRDVLPGKGDRSRKTR